MGHKKQRDLAYLFRKWLVPLGIIGDTRPYLHAKCLNICLKGTIEDKEWKGAALVGNCLLPAGGVAAGAEP